MSYILGLTGSIAMGKSTTAALFAAEGLPVWDADMAVHRLYDQGGAAVAPLAAVFPEAQVGGAISRDVLRRIITEEPTALDQLEAIVHPLVALDRSAFIEASSSDIIVLDIPLLFETGADKICDGIAVVTASRNEQRRRAFLRPEMTEERFSALLARQIPDEEKRARADWVIETTTPEQAARQVRQIITEIRKTLANA